MPCVLGECPSNLTYLASCGVQARAHQEQLCPVCWDERKEQVFNCGHQTCVKCGEQVSICPICRVPVTLRIRVY